MYWFSVAAWQLPQHSINRLNEYFTLSVCQQFGHDLTVHAIQVWLRLLFVRPGSFPKISGYGKGSVCDYRTQNHFPVGLLLLLSCGLLKWQFASSRPTGNCLCCFYSLQTSSISEFKTYFKNSVNQVRLPKRVRSYGISYSEFSEKTKEIGRKLY